MTSKSNWLISVEGPTGSGKSGLAAFLAASLNCPVISADARQCYREMRIGVARPSEQELAMAPHYFIADRSVTEALSAGSFEREALELLKSLFARRPVVVLVGGSGFYIQALLEGFDQFPPVDEKVRQGLRQLYEEEGLEHLQELIRVEDPAYAAQVDMNNPHRLLRALEVGRSSGRAFSSYRQGRLEARPFSVLRLKVERPREELYRRIDLRVDEMIQAGLEEEARSLLPLRRLSPLDTVGYREMFDYFDGVLTFEQAVQAIRQHSRNYAKRQITWLKRQRDLIAVNADKPEEVLKMVLGTLPSLPSFSR